MKSLERLRGKHKRASQQLAEAVGDAFPIHAPVYVKRGRGEMLGTVTGHPSWWSEPTRIFVASSSGRVHTADYHDCRLAGGKK